MQNSQRLPDRVDLLSERDRRIRHRSLHAECDADADAAAAAGCDVQLQRLDALVGVQRVVRWDEDALADVHRRR